MSDTLQERLRARAFRLATQDMNGDGAALAKEAADRIDQLERELQQAQRNETAIRELMNVYNLGGWTDAEGPMKRALAAESSISAMRKALFKSDEWDAGYNLMGALHDLKRLGADAVSITTIERVLGQIASARAALHAQQSAPVIHDAAAHADVAQLVAKIDALYRKATPYNWHERGRAGYIVKGPSFGPAKGMVAEFDCGNYANSKEEGVANAALTCMLVNAWPALRDALQPAQEPNSQTPVSQQERSE